MAIAAENTENSSAPNMANVTVAIHPETRDRVLAAARALGYHPNMAARALMNGRTGIIGFWMSLAYSCYRGQVLDHMRTLLQRTEFAAAVTDIDDEYSFSHSFDRRELLPAARRQ